MTVRDLFEMNGRVAVVTGSGQGIGRSIALGLADFGCDVVLNSRRIHDLEAGLFRLGTGIASLPQPHHHIYAGISQVIGMGMSLAPIA